MSKSRRNIKILTSLRPIFPELLYNDFVRYINDTHNALVALADSHEVYSSIVFKLATNTPLDPESELQNLAITITNLKILFSSLQTNIDSSKNHEKILNDILKINQNLSSILDVVDKLILEMKNSTQATYEAYRPSLFKRLITVYYYFFNLIFSGLCMLKPFSLLVLL